MWLKKIANEETVLYLAFGVLTTIVSFGSFAILQAVVGDEYYLINNVGSFICAVTFAFVTNKQFVFKSSSWKLTVFLKEFVSFVLARIASFLIIEEGGLFLAVAVLKADAIQVGILDGKMVAKIVLAFVAVVVNYIAGKFLVFKKK